MTQTDPEPTSQQSSVGGRQGRVVGAAWLSGMPLVVNAISLLANLVIIPGLGEAGWGIWSTAVGLSGATSFITGLGIRPLFIRALARCHDQGEQDRLVGSQLAIRILLATVASLAALSIGWAVGYRSTILLCAAIAAAGLVPTVIWTVYSDVLNANEAFRASAIASLVSGLVLTAVSLVVVLAGFGPVGVALAYLIGPGLTAVQLGHKLRRRGVRVAPLWDWAEMKGVFMEARLTAAGDGVGNLLTRLNGIYVPALIGPVAYGYYATGNLITSRLQIVGDALITAYTPGISRDHASLRARVPTWSSLTMLRLLLVSGTILGVGALAGSGVFLGLVYRTAAQATAREAGMMVMALTSIALPLMVLSMGWRQVLISANEHDLAARTSAISATINAFVTFGLTWRFGLAGAAAGFLAGITLSAILIGVAAHRVVGPAATPPRWFYAAMAWAGGGAVAYPAIRAGRTFAGVTLCFAALATTGVILVGTRVVTIAELRQWLARITGGTARQAG